MAILERNGALHGTAGPTVFRSFRGRTVVQSRPVRKKQQTPASQASAGEFGLASTTACSIRHTLRSVFRNRHDGAMVNRFNSAVYHSIQGGRTAERGARDLHDGDPRCLEGFEFNAESPLSEALKIKPVLTLTAKGRIRVKMDAISSKKDLKLPEKIRAATDTYRLRFLATAFNFRQEYYEFVAVKDLTIPRWKTLEAQDFEMEGTIPEGCLVIVTLSLECLAANAMDNSPELLNTVTFSPAAIVMAFQVSEAIAMGQTWEQKVEAWSHYERLSDYAGNEFLEHAARQREKRAARGKTERRRKRTSKEPPGSDTSRKSTKAAKTEGADEPSFVIGRRFKL